MIAFRPAILSGIRPSQERHGLDPVAVGIFNESCVIALSVLRPQPGLDEDVRVIERADAASAGDMDDRSFVRGIFKAGFFVSDLDAAASRARAHGAAFAQEITQPAGNPYRTFALHDPDENVIQLFGA